jgi:hypothetical protein
MNSQTEPSTDPRSGPLGSRAVDPRSQAGQWTPADLLDHHREFALAVGAALAAPGISDMMRLVRITVAHSRLVRAVR